MKCTTKNMLTDFINVFCIFLQISDEEYSTSTNKRSTRTSKYETRRLTTLTVAKGQDPQHISLNDKDKAPKKFKNGNLLYTELLKLTVSLPYLIIFFS